ncbi:MAG: YecA family protein [Anaerolineae bacterium]
MSDLGRIVDQMLSSGAMEIESRFGTLGTNYFVFETNYEELKHLITKTQTPDQMWKSSEVNAIMYELTRLIHNFLASAKMLVELTRNVMRDWYNGTELLVEYQSEIDKRFKGTGLTGFIEDLRNYTLHYQLPITMSRVEVVQDQETKHYVERAAFELSRIDLRKWKNWVNGKEYLAESDKEIVIGILIDEYFYKIQDFHGWIITRLAKEHSKDLNWLEGKRVELEKTLNNSQLLREREDKHDWQSKIPRNAPCPCGSGRKYKHCCGSNSSSRDVVA